LLEKFAGYGFNKSHSAAYGVISYQTAYLKAHYPVEFMAGLLSNEINNTDKISVLSANAEGWAFRSCRRILTRRLKFTPETVAADADRGSTEKTKGTATNGTATAPFVTVLRHQTRR